MDSGAVEKVVIDGNVVIKMTSDNIRLMEMSDFKYRQVELK